MTLFSFVRTQISLGSFFEISPPWMVPPPNGLHPALARAGPSRLAHFSSSGEISCARFAMLCRSLVRWYFGHEFRWFNVINLLKYGLVLDEPSKCVRDQGFPGVDTSEWVGESRQVLPGAYSL